ncbi:MAG: hypothetical protein KGL21_04240, partial [Alphaproteobacteria bacterium]|nr:hypothetical protein [Alphaproteobacteria bacterium]
SLRLSGSGWALVRGAGNPSLSDTGELGGSQAGVRINLYPGRGDKVGLTARLTGPLAQVPGKEIALGVILHPIAHLPVSAIVEQRFALDSGGRNDAELIFLGGVYDRPVAHGIFANIYSEAGIVGIRARDMFADGSVELEHFMLKINTLSFAAGAGIWGAAQPSVARIDVGPQLVLRSHIGPAGVRLTGGYRVRLAGNARPGSGPALSLGTSF